MKNELSRSSRFDSIMARVDAWADEYAGWDCRAEAEAEVLFTLADPDCYGWSDEEHADNAILAWSMAE